MERRIKNTRKILAKKQRYISKKLLEAVYLLDIMNDLIDGEGKNYTMVKIIRNYVRKSFNEVSKCEMILTSEN